MVVPEDADARTEPQITDGCTARLLELDTTAARSFTGAEHRKRHVRVDRDAVDDGEVQTDVDEHLVRNDGADVLGVRAGVTHEHERLPRVVEQGHRVERRFTRCERRGHAEESIASDRRIKLRQIDRGGFLGLRRSGAEQGTGGGTQPTNSRNPHTRPHNDLTKSFKRRGILLSAWSAKQFCCSAASLTISVETVF